MDSSKKFNNPSPENSVNLINKLFFCWVLPFFKYGYQHDLEVKDIYNSVDQDSSGRLGDQLEKLWHEQGNKSKKNKPSLKKIIFLAFYKSYLFYGIWLFLQVVIIRSLQPLTLAWYIGHFESKTEFYDFFGVSIERSAAGWILASLVIFLAVSDIMVWHYLNLGMQRVGMRVRIACCSLVYRKLLRLSQASLGQTATGQLINLLSNDVQRFELVALYLHFIWIMPIQFATAFYIMYNNIGWAALAGMAAVLIEALPLQGYLSRKQGQLRMKIAKKTDYRIKIMDEIITGIQVIKMYAWEKPFEKVVELARRFEVKYIDQTSQIKGFSMAAMVFTERLALYLNIVVFVLLGGRLSSDIVFSMAQLINSTQLYVCILFPWALSSYSEARVTIKRLEEFLRLEENQPRLENNIDRNSEKNIGLIELENASASWMQNPVVNTLIDINVKINPGMLCCIVGNVGSGKSSFLQILLRELPLKVGKMKVCGSMSYASQEPWLFVSSVRNNILFGQPHLKNRYKDVVRVCALQKDFEQFPHGDRTLVGERGVSLSGGQRARVNLARAVYSEADIYLFDDPLSAVDTHVAKHLFEECFMKYLNGKTRILVTHQVQFLSQADWIIVLKNGQIESQGTFDDLPKELLKSVREGNEENKETGIEKAEADIRERIQSIASVGESVYQTSEPEETQELIEKGSLSSRLYLEYFSAGANFFTLIFLVILLIIAQVASNSCDLWVRYWTNMKDLSETESRKPYLLYEEEVFLNATNPLNRTIQNYNYKPTGDLSQNAYVLVYTILITGSVVLTSARSLLFFKICMKASQGLHNKMFSNVLKAPMRFFDTNPSGRILNRFSKDIGTIDEILPNAMLTALQVFLVMSGILLMGFIVSPWMIAPAVVLGFVFFYIRLVYLKTAQDIKRLDGVTRAPVFSHVSATMYGLPTIRSSDAEYMVIQEFDGLQDTNTGTSFLFFACSETFGLYLDFVSCLFLALVTYQFLLFNSENQMGGDVGLVISSSLILTGMLQVGVRQTTEVTSNMTSVERVLQYTKLDKEEDESVIAKKKPDPQWPQLGKITFKNTYLRYDPEGLPVLKDLNIVIAAGEKVGIVGRTGAGKSTLIASLFRLAPIDGTIAIDNVDTADVKLEDLRSRISIIPQEPILFSATIRYNLDPFGNASDDVIWKALSDVELKDIISTLDQQVSEGGSNFSAGQRQLVCLARAIVRNNKILVMDEATANVDQHTDFLIQKTIRQNFKTCTMLTIAHRLNTIIDCDKVLVMDAGQAVEYDSPHVLLQDPFGYFTRMVEQTGQNMAETLRQAALEAHQNRIQAQSTISKD